MKGYVGLYSPQRAKEISDAVNQLLQFEQGETENLEHDPERWYFVKAKEDILAASDPETGYTTGKVTPLRYTDTDDKDMELFPISVDSELEVTNRTTSDISEDDYFWCRQIEAELVPFIGGSGEGGGSSCCCCVTVHIPSAVLSTGELTVDSRELCNPLGTIHDDSLANLNFQMDFPTPSQMILIKEDTSDDYIWEFDESDLTIIATYDDGDAAIITSVDGSVVFSPHIGGKMQLLISWTIVFEEQPSEAGPPPV